LRAINPTAGYKHGSLVVVTKREVTKRATGGSLAHVVILLVNMVVSTAYRSFTKTQRFVQDRSTQVMIATSAIQQQHKNQQYDEREANINND
jgi:hypothetical protein